MRRFFFYLCLLVSVLVVSCQPTSKKITVAASSVPHTEILEHVKGELKREGIDLVILEVDDYALPNRLLNEGKIDANFFQHIPYLNAEKKHFGYDLIWLAKVHIEPLSLYSTTYTQLDQLPDRAVIAIPSDPSNETRALQFLEKLGLISLKRDGEFLTILDIQNNPKNLKIEELDSALLSHVLPDVAGAVIPGNYSIGGQVGTANMLAQESRSSDYANVLVIKASNEHQEELRRLADLLQSEEVRAFILKKYQGQLIPAF